MRAEEVDILIIPGLGGSGPDHWQSRWERRLKTARRVQQRDWDRPNREEWRARIATAVEAAQKPVILVAYGLGVLSTVEAAVGDGSRIVGGFFVAPPDPDQAQRILPELGRFAPFPTASLAFPSVLVASRNDPFCRFGSAEALARGWSADLIDAGQAGRIDAASGHGPWPEGLLLLSRVLKNAISPEKI